MLIKHTRIGVPLNSRLMELVRREYGWEVWYAITNKQAPREKWIGTFLLCYDDGRVERVTVQPDLSVDVIQVKGVDKWIS